MRELAPSPADRFVDPDRFDRIRTALTESNLDGLVGLSPANSYYLTGVYAGMYSRPVVGVVTDRTSAFGGPRLEARKAERTGWVDRAVVYEDADDPFDVLASIIPDNVDRIGYDQAYARPGWIDELDARLDVAFVDATDTFLDCRMIKTEWELEMMRRTADLAGAGIEAYTDAVAAGRPELDVVDAIQDAFYETYLDQHPEYDIGTANELGQYGFASVLSGGHALEPHSISSAKPIEDGETVVGIALPSLQGYVCEEERTVLVGDVDADIVEAMETLVRVRRETMDLLEAGRGTDEIDDWTATELRDAGYGEHIIHRTGHGEGITIHEGPALNARESGQLEPGMVISVEPGLYFPDRDVALRHSDTFIITDTGAERLTHTDDGVRRA
ncbi:MAG: M24 family metallopeptidase [Halobacteriales archaeon]